MKKAPVHVWFIEGLSGDFYWMSGNFVSREKARIHVKFLQKNAVYRKTIFRIAKFVRAEK